MYHRLTPGPESRRALLADAEKALAQSDTSLTVGLDDLSTLDATAMGTLIVALRRMRESGGSLVLHVTRPNLLSELAVSGLDRVFKIIAEPPAPPASEKSKPRKQTGGARKIAGGLA